MIAIRLDAGVLDTLKNEADHERKGYQSLINEILAKHVGRKVAS
jgi:uncharacterized protein (DUF4415 family)